MNNYIVLNKRKNIGKINIMLSDLKMFNSLKNRRTEIWENEDIQISIDKTIIRILIYSSNDIAYYTNLITRG